MALTEEGDHHFALDAGGYSIGQRTLEAIADLEAYLALVEDEQDQEPIVERAGAYAPAAEELGGEALDIALPDARQQYDGALDTCVAT